MQAVILCKIDSFLFSLQ